MRHLASSYGDGAQAERGAAFSIAAAYLLDFLWVDS
jgi:hypothetical protein